MIKFGNSYGLPERMEITGKCTYEPEGDDESYDVYDLPVDDYVERNERQKRREIIKAQAGYKTRDELALMRDLPHSERTFPIDPDGSRGEVRVTADNFSHDLRPVLPESVEPNIRRLDSDTYFSPALPPDDGNLDKLFMATPERPRRPTAERAAVLRNYQPDHRPGRRNGGGRNAKLSPASVRCAGRIFGCPSGTCRYNEEQFCGYFIKSEE